jgi:hypothetical protein
VRRGGRRVLRREGGLLCACAFGARVLQQTPLPPSFFHWLSLPLLVKPQSAAGGRGSSGREVESGICSILTVHITIIIHAREKHQRRRLHSPSFRLHHDHAHRARPTRKEGAPQTCAPLVTKLTRPNEHSPTACERKQGQAPWAWPQPVRAREGSGALVAERPRGGAPNRVLSTVRAHAHSTLGSGRFIRGAPGASPSPAPLPPPPPLLLGREKKSWSAGRGA